MRFVLTDNYLVRCESIEDYQKITTVGLSPFESIPFVQANHKPVFEEIKRFIQRWEGENEILITTPFYLIPGFITELTEYLGTAVKVMPVRTFINKPKLREVYDNYIVETINDIDGTYSIDLIERDLLASIKDKKMGKLLNDVGIPAIINFNNNMNEMEEPTPENFELFYVDDESYKNLLEDKNGYTLFSPYSSLMLVNQLVKDNVSIESLHEAEPSNSTEFSYRLSTMPDTKPFNNSWQSWVYVEMSNSFSVQMSSNDRIIKTVTFSIPELIVKESELQVGELHFGKIFLKITADFFGQLHIKVQTLNNNIYYGIIKTTTNYEHTDCNTTN